MFEEGQEGSVWQMSDMFPYGNSNEITFTLFSKLFQKPLGECIGNEGDVLLCKPVSKFYCKPA